MSYLTRMDYYNRLVFLQQNTIEHSRDVLSLCTFHDIYHIFFKFIFFICHNTGHVYEITHTNFSFNFV